MIPPELRAEIRRLYEIERFKVGTIARQLGVHHSTVLRSLVQNGVVVERERSSMLDVYRPFVEQILRKYPTLPASRLYAMVQERGYPGGPDHFRHQIARLRPKPPSEVFARLRFLPAEQAQVDWAHFGQIEIGKARRKLYAFVCVLSYSRALFARFFSSQSTECFLRGHVLAFEHWAGCPRNLLYDNLKSAVLERQGTAIRFNPLLMDLANHYRFLPHAAGVRKGNEKGRVERAIRFLRGAFWAGRSPTGLERLNADVSAWCERTMKRPWPQDRSQTVSQAFERERQLLIPLPEDPFPAEERLEVVARKTPFVRFDANDYSVPANTVGKTLVLLAGETQVRLLLGKQEVASHVRSYSKGEQIESPEHLCSLLEHKRKAKRHRGFHRLFHAVPNSEQLMQELARRSENLGTHTAGLLRLLDIHGPEPLKAAIGEALEQGTPRFQSVQFLLDQRQRRSVQPPNLPLPLTDHPKVRDLSVTPHDLEDYDQLGGHDDDTQES